MFLLNYGVCDRNRYRKAAEQGLADAQMQLGGMYEFGLGVPQDNIEALKWYRKVADQGHPRAQYVVGNAYESGVGVARDPVLAYMWFHLAAAQGDPDAAKARDMVAAKMTPDQITEAQRLAREWKPTTGQ